MRYLCLMLALEHGQELGDDLVRHALHVRPSLDGADGVHVGHLLEHAVGAEGDANLSYKKPSPKYDINKTKTDVHVLNHEVRQQQQCY